MFHLFIYYIFFFKCTFLKEKIYIKFIYIKINVWIYAYYVNCTLKDSLLNWNFLTLAHALPEVFYHRKIKFAFLKSSVFNQFKIKLERRLLLKSKPGEAGHTFRSWLSGTFLRQFFSWWIIKIERFQISFHFWKKDRKEQSCSISSRPACWATAYGKFATGTW